VIRPEICRALQEQLGDPSGDSARRLGSPALTISSLTISSLTISGLTISGLTISASLGIGDLAIVIKLTQTRANPKPSASFQAIQVGLVKEGLGLN